MVLKLEVERKKENLNYWVIEMTQNKSNKADFEAA